MNRTGLLGLVVILLSTCAYAGHEHVWQQDSLTDGFFGLNDALDPKGIEFSFSVTNIYQADAKGGSETHRRKGRWSGSYDLEMNADLDRLLGVEGASLYMLSEGTWSRESIDSTGVRSPDGTAFGVNGDFARREAFNIIELWYQQSLLDDTVQIRIGKLDMTGGFECRGCPVSFDGNMYANDENTQFLNSALVNNPTIPFPEYGLGAVVHWNPVEHWYLSFGAADAQADKRETGLNTTFHDEDYFVYMAETGITPQLDSDKGLLQGAYRVGMWYDPQPKAHSNASRDYRDDAGVYVSCDQKLVNESDDPADMQGLGSFLRYGYAPSRANDITNFYSFGMQYQGLFEGRDDDVLAIGYAQGAFSDRADSTYTEDYESVTEMYYSAQVTPWMALNPSVQYVTNPGGDSSVTDAVVLGLRALITF
jgi:porin